MFKLLMFSILLVTSSYQTHGLATDSEPRQNVDVLQPISNIMQNLVAHTTQVMDRLISQLANRIERTIQTIVGDIDAILGQAMQQLSQPLIEAQSRLEAAECQQMLSVAAIRQHIDSQLLVCTKDLNDVLETFQSESNDSSDALLNSRAEINDLPRQCERAESFSFGGIVACFMENIVEVNRDIAANLNRLSVSIQQTQQVTGQVMEASQACVENAVADSLEYLNNVLVSCQMNVI